MANTCSSELKFPWEKENKFQGICYDCRYYMTKKCAIDRKYGEKNIKLCSKFEKYKIEPWYVINTPKTKQNDFYERLINRSPYWQKIEKKEDPLVFINKIYIERVDTQHKINKINIDYQVENNSCIYYREIYINDEDYFNYNFKALQHIRLSEFKKLLEKYEVKSATDDYLDSIGRAIKELKKTQSPQDPVILSDNKKYFMEELNNQSKKEEYIFEAIRKNKNLIEEIENEFKILEEWKTCTLNGKHYNFCIENLPSVNPKEDFVEILNELKKLKEEK